MGTKGTDTFDEPAGSGPADAPSAHGDPANGAPAHGDSLLAGVRRLTLLADGAGDGEAIFRGLARELLRAPGADEVHVHRLGRPPVADDLTVVYLHGGDGRLSYLTPRSERPSGVSWVASTRGPFLAADAREVASSLPRLAATGEASCALLRPVIVLNEVEAVVVLVRRSRAQAYSESSIELAGTLADQAATALALVSARAEAGTDPVTGCMNRRAMHRRLQEEIGRAIRTGGVLSCLLIDLDNFKLVNDRRGHQAGDAILRDVGQALVGEVRAFDRVARYGGDEFVVILPNAALDAAAAAATRALQRLRVLPSPDPAQGVAGSAGVAQWQAPMSADQLLAACDAALMRSKREGKGRVSRAAGPISA